VVYLDTSSLLIIVPSNEREPLDHRSLVSGWTFVDHLLQQLRDFAETFRDWLYLNGTDPKIDAAVDDALAEGHFKVIALSKAFAAKWNQAKTDGDTLAAAGARAHYKNYLSKPGVSAKSEAIIALGQFEYNANDRYALQRRPKWPHSPSDLQKS
jgi:hypothetical protein